MEREEVVDSRTRDEAASEFSSQLTARGTLASTFQDYELKVLAGATAVPS